mgnify:CR=1 FL=1
MSKQITLLRVFVASPEDVKEERESITKIINEMNKTWEKENIQVKVVKWETDTAPGVGEDPQDVVNNGIGDDYDIFVGIMWTRFGTPTNRAGSGTAEEFNRSYERHQEDPNSLQIMFYFNQAKPNLDDIDPEQFMLLNDFKTKLGELGVYYWNYNGADEFENYFRMHINSKVRGWGKEWGNGTGKIEIFEPPIEELNEKTEIDGSFDEEEEEGFVDLILIGTENFEKSNESIIRISEAIETVGQNMGERGEEFKHSQSPTPNMKHGRRILKRTAEDMEQFVKRIEPEIPVFSDTFSIGIDSFARAATIINDFPDADKNEISKALTTVQEIKSSIIPALASIQGLRDTVYNLPRISREINLAKKHMVSILDDLIKEIDSSKDLTSEAEKILEKAVVDSKTNNYKDSITTVK